MKEVSNINTPNFKVAIVGCGSIAKVHFEILLTMENVELVALVDKNIKNAVDLQKAFNIENIRCYETIEKCLDENEISVVHICLPHHLHVSETIKVLNRDINVFMEKPPAISREEFVELKESTLTSNAILGFCLQNRFNESTKTVEKLLNNKTYGEIVGARGFVTWNRPKEYYTESDWRGYIDTEGGGCLINQAIHALDLLNYFVGGKHLKLQSEIKNYHLFNDIEVEDTVDAFIEYHNNIKVCFYATTAYVTNSPVIIEICCEKASIRIEGDYVFIIEKSGEIKQLLQEKHNFFGKNYWGSGHRPCIYSYYESLKSSEDFSATILDVEDTFDLVMKIYKKY